MTRLRHLLIGLGLFPLPRQRLSFETSPLPEGGHSAVITIKTGVQTDVVWAGSLTQPNRHLEPGDTYVIRTHPGETT